jgi:hypothetical protein
MLLSWVGRVIFTDEKKQKKILFVIASMIIGIWRSLSHSLSQLEISQSLRPINNLYFEIQNFFPVRML